MARPKSEDKRLAMLAAATQIIAEQGVSAPTAKIAKLAGVAEGSLFTYFSNKDDLLNSLYLTLKDELREVMMHGYPHAKNAKARASHAWRKYVEWGAANPQKRKVITQLGVSDRLTEHSRTTGMEAFRDINSMIEQSIAQGVLRDQPPEFVSAIMSSLAETAIDFMLRDPAQAERYQHAGFQAFWKAIAND
ncbi:MAG: TetR/AcrR family transcriptional regulator [Janthinobacterium lividum]